MLDYNFLLLLENTFSMQAAVCNNRVKVISDYQINNSWLISKQQYNYCLLRTYQSSVIVLRASKTMEHKKLIMCSQCILYWKVDEGGSQKENFISTSCRHITHNIYFDVITVTYVKQNDLIQLEKFVFFSPYSYKEKVLPSV